MKEILKKQKLNIILVVIWMTVIFLFSNQPGETSQDVSESITANIIKVFSPNDEIEKIAYYDKIIRKLAHFSIYTVGGLLLINLFYQTSLEDNKKVSSAAGIGIVYAMTDEFHQLFVVGRTGRIIDVAIDSLGVMLGICLYLLIQKYREHKQAFK